MNIANKQDRIIITFDTDFGNLICKQKHKTKGIILLRIKLKSPQQITETLEKLLTTKTPMENCFIVVREYSIRILPIT